MSGRRLSDSGLFGVGLGFRVWGLGFRVYLEALETSDFSFYKMPYCLRLSMGNGSWGQGF